MRCLVALVMVGACYRPALDPACQITCDPAAAGQPGACPNGLTCNDHGVCAFSDGSCGLGDGGVDTRRDAGDASLCYGGGLYQICLDEEPDGAVLIADTFDSTSHSRCDPIESKVCLVVGQRIELSAALTLTGSRPIVFLASERIDISALVDASSGPIGKLGPGVDTATLPPGCQSPASAGGGAGGAGGSFGGLGGQGANSARAAGPVVPLTEVRGGCPGDPGGTGNAPGGTGGGAVYFLAGQHIVVTSDGAVNASGMGGSTATPGSGAGGGSGGLIGFDAPSITMDGRVWANGGGGGGASDGGASSRGLESTGPGSPAQGGAPSTARGGDGSAGTNLTGESASTTTETNGGGGGGGAGYIVVHPASQVAAFAQNTSPPPTQ